MSKFANEYTVLDENTTIVYVKDKSGNIKCQFYIDTEDLPKVRQVKCREDKGRIIFSTEKSTRGQRQLSRYLLGVEDDYDLSDRKNSLVVDHIDHNPYNNKKNNLRIVTVKVNSNNRLGVEDAKSIHGIEIKTSAKTNKYIYVSYMYYKNKKIHLGCYKNPKEAIYARMFGEKFLYGKVKQIERPALLKKSKQLEIENTVTAQLSKMSTK